MIYVIEDQNKREFMEDTHCIEFNIYNNYDYFGIFDGHGSDKVAIFAKLYLKEIIRKELSICSKQCEEETLLKSLRILNTIVPKDIAHNAGCTAVVILRKGKTYWIANIGDSRIIMNSNKIAVSISEDHKPNLEREYKRITDLGGFVLNMYGVPRVMGNLALSRALGDFSLSPYVTWEPDIYKVECNSSNHFFIVASDGLWDTISNQETVDIVLSSVDIAESCKKLVHIAKIKGSTDNITVLFIKI
jgi:serine/threonine protein phosphatase PrpC